MHPKPSRRCSSTYGSSIRRVLEQVRPLLDTAFPGIDPGLFYPETISASSMPWTERLRHETVRDQEP